MMRLYSIAGLIAMSLSSANLCVAQESLWFVPATKAGAESNSPAAEKPPASASTNSAADQASKPLPAFDVAQKSKSLLNNRLNQSPSLLSRERLKPRGKPFSRGEARASTESPLPTKSTPASEPIAVQEPVSESAALWFNLQISPPAAVDYLPQLQWQDSEMRQPTMPVARFESTVEPKFISKVQLERTEIVAAEQEPARPVDKTQIVALESPSTELLSTEINAPPLLEEVQSFAEIAGETLVDEEALSLLKSKVQAAQFQSATTSSNVVGPSNSKAVVYSLADSANTSTENDQIEGKARQISMGLRQSSDKSSSTELGLLDTAAMIGPLQSADGLLNRLDIEDNFRAEAAYAPPGSRTNVANVNWMPVAYTWISPAFYHKPLYFEQPNLERYGNGHSRIAQPFLSSVHFFGSIPLLPYKTLTQHPREKVYTLGHYRPGNCAPIQRKTLLGQSYAGEFLLFYDECSGY